MAYLQTIERLRLAANVTRDNIIEELVKFSKMMIDADHDEWRCGQSAPGELLKLMTERRPSEARCHTVQNTLRLS